jgi:hypothetical protein
MPEDLRHRARFVPAAGLIATGVLSTRPPYGEPFIFLLAAAFGVLLAITWRNEYALILPVPAACSGCLAGVTVLALGDAAYFSNQWAILVIFLAYGFVCGVLAFFAAGISLIVGSVAQWKLNRRRAGHR